MTKHFLAMIGSKKVPGARCQVPSRMTLGTSLLVLCTLLTIQSILPSPALAARNIYKDMQDLTRQQLLIDQQGKPAIDLHVKRFTAATISQQPFIYLRREVQDAFDPFRWSDLLRETDYRPGMAYGQGATNIAELRTLASREERVRALGRELQLIATSYEAPVISPEYAEFPQKARAVIRIWQAGTGSMVRTETGLLLQAKPMDASEALKQQIKKVGETLKNLIQKDDMGTENREAFVAAVWRYFHGERFVTGKRKDDYPLPPNIPDAEPGTERQFLKKQYPELEKEMERLWQALRATVDTKTLKNMEVVWFTLKDEARDELLPENILLWAYVEKKKDGTLTGDIGFQWMLGLEPVQPSLCRDNDGQMERNEKETLCETGGFEMDATTTHGGAFPPPPVDGTGLCTQPFQRLGYLCRPIVGDAGTNMCKQETKPSKDKIVLSACTQETGSQATLMGPDACQTVNWKAPVPFDVQKHCKIKVECGPLKFGGGQLYPKDKNGVIRLVIAETGLEKQGPPVPMILHELTHARQYCENPPGFDGHENLDKMSREEYQNVCCRVEGEAYRAACAMLDQYHNFRDRQTGKPLTVKILDNKNQEKAIELNVETCWQLLTDASCRERSVRAKKGEVQCPNTFTYTYKNTLSIQDAAFVKMNELMFKNLPPGTPRTCQEATDPKREDPMVGAIKRSLEQVNMQVCDPSRVTEYTNTIGGTMCYIDQCLEQSIEDHRLIAGRQTFNAGETAFVNEACIASGVGGSTVTNVPLNLNPPLPAYRPELLIQTLDAELCQQNGLPPQSPPSRCAFSLLQTLNRPEEDILRTAIALWNDPVGVTTAIAHTEQLSEALGARIATELYKNYLDASIPKLASITGEAASLLQTFTKVTFSQAMCAFKDPDNWLLGSSGKCTMPLSSSSAPKP